MAQQLRWRATFIDGWAEDAVEERLRSRTMSDALLRDSSVADEVFHFERKYVATFSVTFHPQSGSGGKQLHSGQVEAASGSGQADQPASEGEDAPLNSIDTSSLAGDPLLETLDASASETTQETDMRSEPSEASDRLDASASETTQETDTRSEPSEASDRAEGFSSIGSRGHPFFCVRPCLFNAMGLCKNGTGCGFCHEKHDAKGRHLDKYGRELIKKLNFQQRVAIAMPVLRRQATQHGLSAPALAFLDQLEVAALKTPAAAQPLTTFKAHKLECSLAGLNFLAILSQICKGDDTPPDFRSHTVIAEFRQCIFS
eukprot:CAMPEP_0171086394 /NCGR_PEP_ID=MMETSP0766_2-20121228/19517_1 /TAXON_ID=439317 /ORGANISM="Gambierdiscus australes, Strain CAWD 149" /LENGTH=314 /DNA_ID=CAMNT_0011544039 /DNA_START=5 /DNA_END=949 /DNA_ORIENTATION=+